MAPRFQRLLITLMVLVPALLFFVLNDAVPRFADDYCRHASHFSMPTIVDAVNDDYVNWTGRVPVMLLNRMVFSLGDLGITLFDLCNAMMMAAALLLVLPRTGPRLPGAFIAMGLFLFLLWFSPHRTGEFLLWKTGAIQYFWGCVIAAWILKPQIEVVVFGGALRWHPGHTAAYATLAFVGGAWLETLSVAVAGAWLILMAHYRANHGGAWPSTMPRPMLIGFFAWLAGTALLLAAPGNYKRAETIGFIDGWVTRLLGTLELMLKHVSAEVLVTGCLLLALVMLVRPGLMESPGRGNKTRPQLQVAGYFALIGALATLALIAAPEATWVGRVVFPLEFFLVLAVATLAQAVHLSSPWVRHGGLLTVALMLGATGLDFGHTLSVYQQVSLQESQRAEIIALARNAGVTRDIQLPPLYFSDEISTTNVSVNEGAWFARDITAAPSHWRNVCYAKANGVETVVLQAR